MLARVFRILLGLLALWLSRHILLSAALLRDDAIPDDIGITHGVMPPAAPQYEKELNPDFAKALVNGDLQDEEKLKNMPEPFIETKQRKKHGNIFDEIIALNEQERMAREKETKARRQPHYGDENFWGVDPAVVAKRPENVAKLAEAKDMRQWSEAAKYLGYLLILSGIFPGLWEMVFGKKTQLEGVTDEPAANPPAGPEAAKVVAEPPPAGDAGPSPPVVDEARPVHGAGPP
jgi:hypothetical protein